MAIEDAPFRVESGILDLEFHSLPCGRADVRSVPIMPGGHLTGKFAFQSNLREGSGAYLRPDFGLAWELAHGKAGSGESKFGGDGVDCIPCTATTHVAVSLFDPQTGKGAAQFDVPMFAWVMGTPLSEGENSLTLYLAPRNQLKREWDGPPNSWTHRFDPVELVGRFPDLSVNLHALRLRRGQETEVTIVRAQPAESDHGCCERRAFGWRLH
jgi:hypothetical protein